MKYFEEKEFACSCCGVVKADPLLKRMLDVARETAGVPFQITSAYRCPDHNRYVGGKEDSAHTKGLAIDLACSDSTRRSKIIKGLILAGFNRIGIAHDFIHADVDKNKPSNVMWLY